MASSLFLFILITSVSVWREREGMIESAHEDSQTRVTNSLAAIEGLTWQLDVHGITNILNGLTQSGTLVGAKLISEDETILVRRAGPELIPDRTWTVPIMGPDHLKKIGELQLSESFSELKNQMYRQLSILAVTELLKFLAVTLILFTVISQMITKHLRDLAQRVGKLDTLDPEAHLSLKRKESNNGDELDLLVTAINKYHRDRAVEMHKRILVESELLDSETRLIDILNVSPIAVHIARRQGHEVVFCNRGYGELIKNDQALGDDPSRYFLQREDYEKILSELANGGVVLNRQIELSIPDKAVVWTLASYMPIHYKGEKAVLGWFYDITNLKNAEDKILLLAFHDPLTNLPNRTLLLDRLQQALASSTRTGKNGALLFIDLDNFKSLNDTLGHAMGDMLLQQVAQLLTGCVREDDTVARLGGDEFVVILEGLSEQTVEAAEQTRTIGEKILATLGQPYKLDIHDFRGSASIGVTIFSGARQDSEELLKQADIAMYHAKNTGRNFLHFFDPQMQETINAKVALERELHQALEIGQFQLHYQVQMSDGRNPLGAEALIRWLHPERGMVSPAQFIPVAEENGLILPIGRWVLENACAQLKSWERDESTKHLVLAVNVSAWQFHQVDFVAQVQAVIERYGINPNLLKLELTESLMLENIDDTIATMDGLSMSGVRLSLDDFGTGYSSLQYLKRLPINQLKIDQSFVRDISTDPSDALIVATIIAMADALGLEVIAEGVETEAQCEFLKKRGCNTFQGYLYGRPMPIKEFEELIKKTRY